MSTDHRGASGSTAGAVRAPSGRLPPGEGSSAVMRPGIRSNARRRANLQDMVVRTDATPYNSVTPAIIIAPVNHQTIVVLDFGSQYTQLIARRLRELSVYSEIVPFNTPVADIERRRPAGLILSGGPKSVSEASAPLIDGALLLLGIPTLGICYGMQVMTK